jgi:tetratricopeptide (TPR) repeat protein
VYPTQADYILEVAESLLELNRKRLLLDEDLANLLNEAARQAPLIDQLRPVAEVTETEGANAAFAYVEKLRNASVESLYGEGLNRLEYANNGRGYELLAAGEIETALEVFKLNTLIAPESANAWDSLAECYLNMKSYELSMKCYKKSLELDPENDNARRMIERIEKESKGSGPS